MWTTYGSSQSSTLDILTSHNSAYSAAAITLTTVLPRAFEANHRDIFAAELSGTFVGSVRIIGYQIELRGHYSWFDVAGGPTYGQ